MRQDIEEEDVAPFMLNYSCNGKCEAISCSKAKNTPIWNCELTTPNDCSLCECIFGCNA